MNPEDFEKQLERQPIRPVPAAWRAEILKAANASSLAPDAPRPLSRHSPVRGTTADAPSLLSTLNSQLSAILWPCPQAWAGLAAVWVFIFALNHATLDKPEIMARKSSPPSPEIMMVLQEQRRMLAKLIDSSDQPAAEPPKPFVPRPRGELCLPVTMV
jgi:hypothetical protein